MKSSELLEEVRACHEEDRGCASFTCTARPVSFDHEHRDVPLTNDHLQYTSAPLSSQAESFCCFTATNMTTLNILSANRQTSIIYCPILESRF